MEGDRGLIEERIMEGTGLWEDVQNSAGMEKDGIAGREGLREEQRSGGM